MKLFILIISFISDVERVHGEIILHSKIISPCRAATKLSTTDKEYES